VTEINKKSLQKDLERMKINTYLCNPETNDTH